MKNTRTITYTILILSTLGTLGLAKNIVHKEHTKEVEENKNEILIYNKKTENSKYELLVYLNNDKNCEKIDCQKLIKIKTETPYAKELNVKQFANYILIYDGVIKLIDINKKEQEELKIPYTRNNNYEINLENESEIEKENKNKKIKNIISSNTKEIKYYDYTKKELIESKSYNNITKIDNLYIANIDQNYYLLDNKGIELFILNKEINNTNIAKINKNNNYISITYKNDKNQTAFIIYNLTGKEIIKKAGEYTNVELGEKEFYIYETTKLLIYNIEGTIKKTLDIKDYNIKFVYKNYLIAINNDNLISYNITDNKASIITNMLEKEIININYKNTNKPGVYIDLKNNNNELSSIYYNLEKNQIENLNK